MQPVATCKILLQRDSAFLLKNDGQFKINPGSERLLLRYISCDYEVTQVYK